MRRIPALSLPVVFALLTPLAGAQSAASGEKLYATPVVPGKLSCSANACHGSTTQPQNRIANGLSAANIKAAVGRVAQMRFLDGQLGDAQFNDLSAYLSSKLGGTPSYLQVVAMPQPVLAPAALAFGALDLLTTSPAQAITLTNAATASAPLVLGSIGTTAGSDFAVTGGTCRSGDSLPVASSCSVLVSFTPSALGTRSGELRVVHNGAAALSTRAEATRSSDLRFNMIVFFTNLYPEQALGKVKLGENPFSLGQNPVSGRCAAVPLH